MIVSPSAGCHPGWLRATSTDAVYVEKNFYDIKSDYIVNKSTVSGLTDYPNNNGNPPYNNNPNSNVEANSEKLYKLNAATNKTGLGITLKVMAGDQIDIYGKSYWFNSGGNYSEKFPVPVSSLIDAFLGSPAMVGKGVTTAGISTPGLLGDLAQFTNRTDNVNAPWAYINWIFFDEQFKYAGGGFDRVGGNGVRKDHQLGGSYLKAPKNGYVFVYCSNESQHNVYFDNLQVFHNRGPLLEETHYYPFGLTMAGISSKALSFGAPENKRKYNGIEYENSFDLNIGETFFRTHDVQLGRWWQIDPKPSLFMSPYSAMSNNPVLYSDFLGDTTWVYNTNGAFLGIVNDKLKNQVHFMSNGNNNSATPFDAIKLTTKEAKQLARAFRLNSVAFIGSNTITDMNRIANKAEALNNGKGVELGFVGTVSDTKEIRLNELPSDQGSKNDYDLHAALKEKYQPGEQKGLFLWGHVHHSKVNGGFTYDSDRKTLETLGSPSFWADYQPHLIRNNNHVGQSAALLLSPSGFTVYGSGTSYTSRDGNFFVPGAVVPSPISYILYKSLK